MIRYRIYLLLFALFTVFMAQGQYKYEREYRIKKNQFPDKAHALLKSHIKEARKVKYYREVDSTKVSYEAKFKLARLFYSAEFDADGNLEDVEVLIKEVDIPNESLAAIKDYLSSNFRKHRILKIQQQYPVSAFESPEETLRNAFQNLLLPVIKYELIVAAKKDKRFEDFEILFDSDGKFISSRKSLPANYDHILY